MDRVAEAVDLADGFVRQIRESGAQVVRDAVPVTLSSEETEVMSLSANFEKALEEAVSAKLEMGVLLAAAMLATNEHNVGLAKVREER